MAFPAAARHRAFGVFEANPLHPGRDYPQKIGGQSRFGRGAWKPGRGASVLAVLALHAFAIMAIVGTTRSRDSIRTTPPMEVVVIAQSRPHPPEPARRWPSPQLAPALRDTIPMPEISIDPSPASTNRSIALPEAPAAMPASTATRAAADVVPPAFDAAYLANPAPAYPVLSRRLGEEGRVLVRVLVTAEGVAESVQLARSCGFERLDRAALDAVARWRFVPARQGTQVVAAHVLVPVQFQLKG